MNRRTAAKFWAPTLSRALLMTVLLATVCFAADNAGQTGITQFSTFTALAAGKFDGLWRCGQVLKFGDFGIGTLEGLDGETILLDGIMYQAKSDGTVNVVPSEAMVPFSTATFFHERTSVPLAGIADYAQLGAELDKLLPTPDAFYAFRIDGTFAFVKVRSCPKQNKPYPPLAEVTKTQSVFDLKNFEGTLVGFHYPAYLQGLNLQGYHFHFISKDKSAGGHVMECQVREAKVQMDRTEEFHLILGNEKN